MGAMLLRGRQGKHRGYGPLLHVSGDRMRERLLAVALLSAQRRRVGPGPPCGEPQYSTRTRNVPSIAAIASRRLAVCSSSAVTSMTT